MTLEELTRIQRDLESEESLARNADRARQRIAEYRAGPDEPRIQIPRRGYSPYLEQIEAEVNKDFTTDIAGDLFRVAEMRLEREARQHRNRARLLRQQIATYLDQDEQEQTT